MRVALAGMLLVMWCGLAPAQDAPARGMNAAALCDLLLAGEAGQRDRAMMELNVLTERSAEELGREILARPVLEGRRLLGCIGRASGDNAIIAAFVCLDSRQPELRTVVLDTLLDAPLLALRKAGDAWLKAGRRTVFRSMLADKDALKRLCESLPEESGQPQAPVERTLRLAILADRYYGAEGFLSLMGTLADLMAGEPEPPAEPARRPEAKPGEKTEDKAAVARARAEKLRRQAASLFEAIWIVAPGAQFNYLANAPIEERQKATGRIHALLNQMRGREIQLGSRRFKGTRLGDYLLGFGDARMGQFGHEVLDFVAAAYMRLRWWKGDNLPVEGERYAKAVQEWAEMGRRQRGRTRAEIQRWWETYRGETDPRE